MSKGTIILIGGGVRSGKSTFALTLARRFGNPRAFIATAEAKDDEMRERISRHQVERGKDFETVEEPFRLPEVIRTLHSHKVIVIDCLTLWLSNLLLSGDSEATILNDVAHLCKIIIDSSNTSIIVTNEVGMGVVPESRLGRSFRDICGRAHQLVGRYSEEVYFAALGSMLRIKPSPVVAVSHGEENGEKM